jgi:hypothetical protein
MTQSQFGEENFSWESHQPSYVYRDESLAALKQGDPIAIQRRQRFIWQRLFIMLSFVVLIISCAMILPARYSAVYATYQQGSCTITGKKVQEHENKDKHGRVTSRSYSPIFLYKVHTAHDGLAYARGFDGPTSVHYPDFRTAQEVADRYEIGQRTSCWYNPSNPSHAFIVFYDYLLSDAIITLGLSLLGFATFYIALYFLFDWTVWRLYALAKRGVLAQGMVLRHDVRRDKSKKYTMSVISFRAAEEAIKERSITVKKVLPIGSQVPVCYDPFYPRYRRYDGWPARSAYVLGAVGMGVSLIAAVIVMLFLWFVP